MTLSVAQMALMSRLLDEALPLDAAGRRDWLDKLSPECQELAQYLREALLPGDAQAAELHSLSTLPKFGATDHEGPMTSSGLQPGARVGPYELMRLLGAGGMAEVWLARRADGAFNREVALKLPLANLRADLEQRFARERDILASLEHPLIARLYDAGIDPKGLPYLAMEYVPGQPLTSRCDALRLAIPERLELILQVLEAVQYAHEKHVIHRDLKPSNILVTASGQVRLLDFGVSKLLRGADEEQLTQLTSIYGRALTPDYACPELLYGDTADARSDIYSVGVLLYEMLTGVRPYHLKNAASIGMLGHAIATVDIKKPSTQCGPEASAARNTTAERLTRQLKGDLDAIVLKALAREPAERYQNAEALADDLRRHLHHKAIRARPDTPGYRLRALTSRHRPLARLSAVAAVMLMGGGLLTWFAADKDYFWRNPLANAKFSRLLENSPETERAAAISRDGKLVAFLAERDGQTDAWVSDVSSGAYRNLTNGNAGELVNPEIRTLGFSVDSSLVTVWTRRADGSRSGDINIVAVPTAGGPLQPFLPEAAEFAWSRDGKRLVYHTTAPGDPYFLHESGEPDNHRDRRIYVAAAGVHSHFPVWSPDDAYIYLVRGVPPDDWDIWRIQPSGAGLERLTSDHKRITFPVMLDRRTLLYLSTDRGGSGPWMYAMDVARRVPHRISSGLERYTSLAASSDGTRLVATIASARTSIWRIPLTEERGTATAASGPSLIAANAVTPRLGTDFLLYVSRQGDREGIWSLAHGTTREIWSSLRSHINGGPAITPDGRRIAFSVGEGEKTLLYIMDRDGAHLRVLSDSLELRGNPAWAPDGQSIVSAVVRDGVPRLTRIFLNGDSPIPLVSEHSVDPVWSPDGRFLVYSGADVGTTFPLRAAAPDGRPYPLPSVILSRGTRVAFFHDPQTLVIVGGEIGHQNSSLLDLRSGVQHILAELPADFVVRDFDVSASGSEIVFDRLQVNSDLALIDRTP